MLARATTYALAGLEPRRVTVEADVRQGLPALAIVGLADRAVREARERVQAAVANSGYAFPQRRVTINLAPASLRKAGPGYDLAIACAVLAAAGELPPEALSRCAIFGELSLGGELLACNGALAVAEGARRDGLSRLLVPRVLLAEATLVDGLQVHGAQTLRQAVELLAGRPVPPDADDPAPPAAAGPSASLPAMEDLADVRAHPVVLEALTIAAAGGHNLLLTGPPGTGKTMLARRLPSILPDLDPDAALEVTRIHSIAGARIGGGLVTRAPFRAPHHNVSTSALVGGGANPLPGEVTLAHRGVLFLDELAEFPRHALEALRQPLEDGHVTVVRAQRTAHYPARFMLVAATNPCPCGFRDARTGPGCSCSEADLAHYDRRLSGPLLDRLDLVVRVERPSGEALEAPAPTSSAAERARVQAARARQAARLGGGPARTNAEIPGGELAALCAVGPQARARIRRSYVDGLLSARGRDRVLRVARTIADLDGSEAVGAAHVDQALQLRLDPDARSAAVAA